MSRWAEHPLSAEYREQLNERLAQRLADPHRVLADRAAVVADLRDFLDQERVALHEGFLAQPSGTELAGEQAVLVDALLAGMYRLATQIVEDRVGTIPAEADLCLAAVGGYGRAALAPWSDIDVVFIPAHEENETIDALVREVLLLLNDTLLPSRHPQVAHSYRPLGDLALIDHQTATALLESRHVAGNGSLHVHFMQQLVRSIEPVEFVHLNLEERRVVWEDRRQSIYAVEPNFKSGPGGLRDFHAAIWVAKVVYGIQEWDILSVLRQNGVISWDECDRVLVALEFILLCRNWLHYARGQKLDQLHVDYQHDLGVALGYRGDDGEMPAEKVMRRYYEMSRIIHDFAYRLLTGMRHLRLGFRHHTHVVNWTMYPNHDGIFREDPARLVQVYEERQRLALRHSVELERLISGSVGSLDAATREKLPIGASFLRLLALPGDVAETLRDMLRTGVLEALLPEFAPLMMFLPGDPAHEYTVGEHSLKVIDELQRLRDRPRTDDEKALSEPIRALQEPEVLYLAALFHDVGKLDRSGEHSRTGAPVGAAVAARLGMQDKAIERVRFLILQHLVMLRTARLRSLQLPDTIDQFIQLLPDDDPLDALDMLTILTWADARSVGEHVFRDNERRLLMELFIKAAKWIQERPMVDEPGARERLSRRLREAPALRDREPEEIRRHLQLMPTWYAVNTPPALIAKHLAYLQRLSEGENPVVEFYHTQQAMHTELTVCTYERPGLLRDIAAAVTANNLDIFLAQSDVVGTDEGADQQRSIAAISVDDYGQPLGQVKRDRLRADLESILRNEEPADAVLARRGKIVPEKVALKSVKVNNTDSRQHTVVMVRADDQKGLLYRLTSALAAERLELMVAKITTWSGTAEDAFYVVSRETKQKLSAREADGLAARLIQRLAGEAAGVERS